MEFPTVSEGDEDSGGATRGLIMSRRCMVELLEDQTEFAGCKWVKRAH
jgi:hypothetical protein